MLTSVLNSRRTAGCRASRSMPGRARQMLGSAAAVVLGAIDVIGVSVPSPVRSARARRPSRFGGDFLQQPPAEAVAQEQHDAFHLALEMLPQARVQRPAAGRRGGRARVEQAHDGRGKITDRQPIVTGKHDLIGPCRVDRHEAVGQDGVFQLASQLARHAASFVVRFDRGQTEGSLYPILARQGDSGARAGFSRKRVTNS